MNDSIIGDYYELALSLQLMASTKPRAWDGSTRNISPLPSKRGIMSTAWSTAMEILPDATPAGH